MIRTLLREFARRLHSGEPRDEILKDMGGRFAQCNPTELRNQLARIVVQTKHRKDENMLDQLLANTPYGKIKTKSQKAATRYQHPFAERHGGCHLRPSTGE